MNFHCVPNQVLYQAEPLPDTSEIEAIEATQKLYGRAHRFVKYSIRYCFPALSRIDSRRLIQCHLIRSSRRSNGSARGFL